MNEIPEAVPVDGMYARVDEGGVCLIFTRRVLAGVETTKENPQVASMKFAGKVVAEIWMSKEMAFVVRKTLNETLTGKPLPPPKAEKKLESPEIG